jgi:hypothetical protein
MIILSLQQRKDVFWKVAAYLKAKKEVPADLLKEALELTDGTAKMLGIKLVQINPFMRMGEICFYLINNASHSDFDRAEKLIANERANDGQQR